MNPVVKATFMGMIEADLQQAWELLDADQYDLAITHLAGAAQKVQQLSDKAQQEPTVPLPQAIQQPLI